MPYKPVRLEDIQAKTHTAPRYASPVPPTLQVPPVQPYAVRACEWLCRFRIAINGLYWAFNRHQPKPDLLPAKGVVLPSQAGSTTASQPLNPGERSCVAV